MWIVNLFMFNPATGQHDLDNVFGPFATRQEADQWAAETEKETTRQGMNCQAIPDRLVPPADLWRTNLPSGHPEAVQRN